MGFEFITELTCTSIVHALHFALLLMIFLQVYSLFSIFKWIALFVFGLWSQVFENILRFSIIKICSISICNLFSIDGVVTNLHRYCYHNWCENNFCMPPMENNSITHAHCVRKFHLHFILCVKLWLNPINKWKHASNWLMTVIIRIPTKWFCRWTWNWNELRK